MEEEVVEALERVVTQVNDALEAVNTRFELLDARLETGEQHQAELTVAYMELSATLEALLHHIFGSGDGPEAQLYRKAVSENKKAMFDWMENASKHVGTGETSLNEAVLRLVREQSADPDATPGDPGAGNAEDDLPSE